MLVGVRNAVKLWQHMYVSVYMRRRGRSAPEAKLTRATTAQCLGVTVLSKDVRTIPREEDPYVWDYTPEKYHLFHKHISKHNLGACRDLCSGVGQTFRAVSKATAPCFVGRSIDSAVLITHRG